ncbi:MAG: response regulator [Desulfobulbaceae bacterium]|nr:response regulator [Desulfobulbaceae bacterium]
MNGLTILVVDDDPVVLRLLSKRLADAHHEITTATNGSEAAGLIRKKKFDVIITDMVMPGDIGGIELIDIAKEKDTDTEIILITAHSSINTAVDAMRKGANDYLEKPINFDELFLRLEKISEIQSLLRNADDLREAMDVTEASAAQTIQDLELVASSLEGKLDEIANILHDTTISESDKIDGALAVLHG